jgi:NAD(P)H-hydrate epimerase
MRRKLFLGLLSGRNFGNGGRSRKPAWSRRLTGAAPPNQTALLRVAQMTQADRAAIAGGTPGSVLMQNAAHAVVLEITRRWSPRPVRVLCGPGNNGGDGFAAAVALAELGWPVRVALLGSKENLRGDARLHADRWNGSVETLQPGVIEGAALIVDALFGSGLSRPLESPVAATLLRLRSARLPLIAVDMPSGVMGDSGASVGAAPAICTVTFARKAGACIAPGRDLCGEIVVADIGIPTAALESLHIDTWENDPGLWRRSCRARTPPPTNTRGVMRCYAAATHDRRARMAARAARRAGLTTICSARERVLHLCRRPHQHHGAATGAGRRLHAAVVRPALHGLLDRARRRGQ